MQVAMANRRCEAEPLGRAAVRLLDQINDTAFDVVGHLGEARGDLGQARSLDLQGDTELERALRTAHGLREALRTRRFAEAASLAEGLPLRLERVRALDAAEGTYWGDRAGCQVEEAEMDAVAIIGITEDARTGNARCGDAA